MKILELFQGRIYPISRTQREYDTNGVQDIWKFQTEGGDLVRVYITEHDVGIVEITFDRFLSIDLNGRGDAIRIFSTVIEIIKRVLKRRPMALIFSAAEVKRQEFYDVLIKRLQPTLAPDYETHKVDDPAEKRNLFKKMLRKPKGKQYVFVRKDARA